MNFRKTMRTIAGAAIASTMVGSAMASTIGGTGVVTAAGVGAYASGLTIAAEAVAPANYTLDLDATVASPLGNLVGTSIAWIPTFGLNAGDIITINFSNALYMGADVKLLAEELAAAQAVITGAGGTNTDFNSDTDELDVIEVASNFGTLDAVNGVSSVVLRINDGLVLPTGIVLLLTSATTASDGAGARLNTNDDITIRIPAGTAAGSTVSLSSSAVTSGGTTIPAAASTNDGTIADLATQFGFAVAGAATSVIDVAAAAGTRLNFLEEAGGATALGTTAATDDTDLTLSVAEYTFTENGATAGGGTVEDEIILAAVDLFTFTLTSSTNLDGVTVNATPVPVAQLGTDGVLNATIDTTLVNDGTSTTVISGSVASTLLNDLAVATTETDHVWIIINGTSVLLDRTFTLSGTLTFSAGGATEVPMLNQVLSYAGGTSHTWTTNGTVLEATYVNTNADFNNRFVLTNMAGTDADYTGACTVETGNTCTLTGAMASGTLSANTTTVINTNTGDLTMGGTGNQNRATVTFTIEGPTNTLQGETQTVKPGTGIEVSHPMVRPGTN